MKNNKINKRPTRFPLGRLGITFSLLSLYHLQDWIHFPVLGRRVCYHPLNHSLENSAPRNFKAPTTQIDTKENWRKECYNWQSQSFSFTIKVICLQIILNAPKVKVSKVRSIHITITYQMKITELLISTSGKWTPHWTAERRGYNQSYGTLIVLMRK